MIEELIGKIAADSGLSESNIRKRVADKQVELSGLISEEGAAYIVAKELGISLLKQARLNIENVMPGMQNVDIVGKIVKISEVREFSTEKASGRVLNMFIADNTGSIRLSLWNDEIDKIKGFEKGDVVNVRGYVRENKLGGLEIRLGKYGVIQKSDEVIEIGDMVETRKYERSDIANIKEGQSREVRASLLHVFDTNPFYEVCSKCGARVREETNFKCEDHPEAEIDFGMVISGIIDDGTGNMRAVFFRENAEKVLGMKKDEAKKIFDNEKTLLGRIDLGKEFIFQGQARRNAYFDRLEFIVNNIEDVDVKKEVEILAGG